jgi:calcineurin-like phosphoesterase family protein
LNTWFTSDWHFGHQNIVKAVSKWLDTSKCRDFSSIEEHDAYILNEVNKRVKPTDRLWMLGDFGFGPRKHERFPEMRARIACEDIRIILGNHDHAFEKDGSLHVLFKRVKLLHYGKISGRHMVLCHYAMRTWPWQHHDSIHLYGHSHGSLVDENGLSMDVGVDTELYAHEKYTPYSAEEVFHIMDTYKRFVPLDHHKGVNP